ncbi:DUF2807 domain-containing protein [Segetibacter sp. 3557_3]|uniref:head GIN domain-containing protein n=1 Tax=Segetibacter sp. 3557_3 TaxID=2547429 RepID=UPI001058746E|nr:head GIN domain-containing protein [Segetibacter sp. 3557_3]TDH28049.1 DUF2807 domain-containing protein [Segetibacter sp. 3557_3]
MKKLPGILALLIIVFFSACEKDVIRGNGNNTTQQRNVASFNRVHTSGDISVHISEGNTPKVEVRAYDNIINIVETDVVNEMLSIRYSKDYLNVRNSNAVVYITVPSLNAAMVNGSGDTHIDGFKTGTQVEARINGSGSLHIGNSNYNKAVFDVNGSGNIRAAGMQVNHADATIHGSGDIETQCEKTLKARISGSGSVRYWGDPNLDVQISGSGKVKRQ